MTSALAGYFCHPDNPLSMREIAKEFVVYKNKSCFDAAIKDSHNPYISFKMKIWMFVFRLPGFVPAMLLNRAIRLKKVICEILAKKTERI